MCGILGLASSRGVAIAHAHQMLATLAHRGPDAQRLQPLDEGRVVLGHTRLSIIDLSPAGSQPMTLEGQDLWLTFNGEIYNHRDLRQQLETDGFRFRSASDTEVLLAAYARWGEAMLDRIDGLFAFGLWDGRRRRLWLVRDHIGVKPLYYINDPRRPFAFASEPKALMHLFDGAVTPDPRAITDYLTFGYVPGERSAFAGIAKLPPAHTLTWENGAIQLRRYWNVQEISKREPTGLARVVDETRVLLDTSTRTQLESDVPVGVLVSGGIDSSSVASSVSRARPEITGFVLGFDDDKYDERRYARELAKRCGIRLEERVLQGSYVTSHLHDLASAYDEPFADSSAIPTLALFELVHDQRFKVVMGGDGGDELFAGYRRYDALLREEGHSQAPWPLKAVGGVGLRQRARLAARPRRYRRQAWQSYYERVRIFSFEQQHRLLTPRWRAHEEAELTWPFERYWEPTLDTIKAAQVFDLQTYLPDDILRKVDRASMHYGVEARVPLLAKRMVEYAIRIPTKIHQSGGRRKSVLKSVIAGRVPEALLTNRKKGFGLPLALSVGDLLRDWRRSIERSALVRCGVITPELSPEIGADLDKMWTLFMLDLWWSRWVLREYEASHEDHA